MRIAFVSIPHFPCAVEIGRNPGLRRVPLIVGDAETPKRVLDHSFSSSEKRVRHGMTIRQAIAECPGAVIIPPDPVLYRTPWEAALVALGEITPEVEDEEMGRAYLNVGGLHHHYGNESDLCDRIHRNVKAATGLDASVGLASGRFTAFAAGTMAPLGESQSVAVGGEAAFLAPLNVALLPCETDTCFRLRLLGLETIADIAALSISEMQSQFGFEGKRLWELSNGIDNELLSPRRQSEQVQATVSLEMPVSGIDVMIALTRQLLSRLKPSLKGRAVREMRLQAELTSGRGWENHVVFREPVSEDERLTFLLRSSLSNFPPPQAIRSLSLRLENLAAESGKQMSLDGKSRRHQHLEEAIRQLKVRYGHSPVYRCMDVDPWSVIPEERQILVESDA